MTEIELKPYQEIKGQKFYEPTKLIIKDSAFVGVSHQAGRMTFGISGCDFREVVIENLTSIRFERIDVHFWNCTIKDINVEQITSPNISIHFGSSIVSGIINSNMLQEVSLNNCILNSSLFLLNQNSVRISFTEENIFPIIWKRLFERNGIVKPRTFIEGKQSYHIQDSKKISYTSNPSKEERKGVYRMQYMKGEDYKIGYRPTSEDKESLNLNLSIIYSSKTDDSMTTITNSLLNSLSLKGVSQGTIDIESTQIENLYVREFLPRNDVTVYNISPKSRSKKSGKIEFHKSNLDKFRFDNIDFDGYSIVSFYRTRFAKSTFSSCNFPSTGISFSKFKTLENVHSEEKKAENFYKDQYELFLQLKVALETGGNFYEAQKLQAISNDALLHVPDVKKWDKLILWINRWSNDHGLSITKPFLLLLLFSILLYLAYLFSLGRLFTSQPFDSSLFGYYFSFIDLTHRPDFLVGKEEYTGWSLGFDFVNKLLVGFFIYQFVAAFRKYGRR